MPWKGSVQVWQWSLLKARETPTSPLTTEHVGESWENTAPAQNMGPCNKNWINKKAGIKSEQKTEVGQTPGDKNPSFTPPSPDRRSLRRG